jgi:hypothetical protein
VALRRGWISEYQHIFRFADFLQAMMVGSPIVGTWWTDGMFRVEPDGRVRPVGDKAGGHEYQPYGVSVDQRRIWFWNSWGSWGPLGGRFWMSWDDFEGLLDDDGDATVLVP